MYDEITVDPVAAGWHQEMIDNPDAQFCFVFMSKNALGKPTASTRLVMTNIIADAVEHFCTPYNIDTWYYEPEKGEYEHKFYTSSDAWIVVMRMMKSPDVGFFKYLLERIQRVEKRHV